MTRRGIIYIDEILDSFVSFPIAFNIPPPPSIDFSQFVPIVFHDDCPICYTNNGQEFLSTKCKHIFCRKCLHKLIYSYKFISCSICRTYFS